MQAISMTSDGTHKTFHIVGDLSGDSVTQLEKLWRDACREPRHTIRIDLRQAQRIAEEGRHLLCEIFGTNGTELIVPVRNRARRT